MSRGVRVVWLVVVVERARMWRVVLDLLRREGMMRLLLEMMMGSRDA